MDQGKTSEKGRAEYRVVLRPLGEEEGGGWLAEIPDLPGCVSDGESPAEALRNVAEAQEAWIATAKELGRDAPAPTHVSEEYSGKFTLRLPRSLHRQLSLRAKAEGVSLNQYILHLISYGMGSYASKPTEHPPGVVNVMLTKVSVQMWDEVLTPSFAPRQIIAWPTRRSERSAGFSMVRVPFSFLARAVEDTGGSSPAEVKGARRL